MTADRLLQFAGALPGEDETTKLKTFRIFMLMHLALRVLLQTWQAYQGWKAPGATEGFPRWEEGVSALIVLCFIVGCFPRWTLTAVRVAAVAMLAKIFATFPLTSNHLFLEFLVLTALAGLDFKNAADRQLLGQALRWMVVIVFFYTGLQKVLYGAYFDGQFFGYMISVDERFSTTLGRLLPAAEFERLRNIGFPPAAGSGPYGVSAPLFVICSNLAYAAELILPVFLLIRRTRTGAAIASIVFIILVQAVAREVSFGLFFINLVLLFPAGGWNRRLFPFFCVVYAAIPTYILMASAGWVPRFIFGG